MNLRPVRLLSANLGKYDIGQNRYGHLVVCTGICVLGRAVALKSGKVFYGVSMEAVTGTVRAVDWE